MNGPDAPTAAAGSLQRWTDALVAAALLAVDPHGLGGAHVHARAGPVRDRWLAALRDAMPASVPWRRLPSHATEGRLLGGLDLAATLHTGRPVAERGLLPEADGGLVVVPMAERIAPVTAALLSAALDAGEVRVERDGLAMTLPARIGVIALDERVDDELPPPAGLRDRLGLVLTLDAVSMRDAEAVADAGFDTAAIEAARNRRDAVEVPDALVEALVGTAVTLGIDSLRAPLQALRVARAAAALFGDAVVDREHAALAGRLVYLGRATRLPAPAEPPDETEDEASPEPPPEPPESPPSDDAPEPPAPETPDDAPPEDADADEPPSDEALQKAFEEVVLESVRAAMPADLLAQLQAAAAARASTQSSGRVGAVRQSMLRGRPVGNRQGEPRDGQRLALLDTLRAAAPWQPLRRRDRPDDGPRILVRRGDLRVRRHRQRAQTTTLFVVDASGSSALHRLAEAKGAVELLLADCYVRRDRVALIAFRGQKAEVVLPPTRSLVRARRSLAGLPGGGGTPLATAIDAAGELAQALFRQGDAVTTVLLTDGRGNIARDGTPGRPQAQADALAAARAVRALAQTVLLVDTAPRPHPDARALAEAMAALYLPLPHADATQVARAVQAVASARS